MFFQTYFSLQSSKSWNQFLLMLQIQVQSWKRNQKFHPKPRTYGIYWGDKLQRTHGTSQSCLLCNLLHPSPVFVYCYLQNSRQNPKFKKLHFSFCLI